MGCAASTPAPPPLPKPDLSPAEHTVSVLLALPLATRRPFYEFVCASGMEDSIAFYDAVEDLREKAELTTQVRKRGGASSSVAPVDDGLARIIDASLERFGAQQAVARDIASTLRSSQAAITPADTLARLTGARLALVRMFALTLLPHFVRSALSKRLEASLRADSAGPLRLGLLDAERAESVTGLQLADALAAERAAGAAAQATAAVGEVAKGASAHAPVASQDATWEEAAAARRAAWLDKLKATAQKLPCMLSVSDMRKHGACLRAALAPCLEAPHQKTAPPPPPLHPFAPQARPCAL